MGGSRLRGVAARLAAWHHSGSLYIGVGALGLAGCALWSARDRARDAEAAALAAVRSDVEALRRAEIAKKEERRRTVVFSDKQPRFRATVARRVHPNLHFDGPLALTEVTVGQTVHVLEEDTGPSEGYHLCRNDFGEGLYPKAFLVRVPETA